MSPLLRPLRPVPAAAVFGALLCMASGRAAAQVVPAARPFRVVRARRCNLLSITAVAGRLWGTGYDRRGRWLDDASPDPDGSRLAWVVGRDIAAWDAETSTGLGPWREARWVLASGEVSAGPRGAVVRRGRAGEEQTVTVPRALGEVHGLVVTSDETVYAVVTEGPRVRILALRGERVVPVAFQSAASPNDAPIDTFDGYWEPAFALAPRGQVLWLVGDGRVLALDLRARTAAEFLTSRWTPHARTGLERPLRPRLQIVDVRGREEVFLSDGSDLFVRRGDDFVRVLAGLDARSFVVEPDTMRVHLLRGGCLVDAPLPWPPAHGLRLRDTAFDTPAAQRLGLAPFFTLRAGHAILVHFPTGTVDAPVRLAFGIAGAFVPQARHRPDGPWVDAAARVMTLTLGVEVAATVSLIQPTVWSTIGLGVPVGLAGDVLGVYVTPTALGGVLRGRAAAGVGLEGRVEFLRGLALEAGVQYLTNGEAAGTSIWLGLNVEMFTLLPEFSLALRRR